MKPLIISFSLLLILSSSIYAQENYFQKISGKITDSLTNKPLSKAQIVLYDINENDFYSIQQGNEIIYQNTTIHKRKVFSSNEEGEYNINADFGKYYHLIVTINGFVTQTKLFSTSEIKPSLTFNFSLENQEVYKDNYNRFLVKVKPIEFEINSVKIKKESQKELNKLVMLLKKYSDFEVEIGVHSSSLASDAFNLKLTTNRANAIFDYVSSFNWPNKNRLTAVGYGETKLINECVNGVKCHPKKHAENKRIELVVKSNYKPTSDFEYLNRNTSIN